MSQGRLLQYDRPTQLVTRPADPFVSQLIGTADRSLRLLSLTAADELVTPGTCAGPVMPPSASLRDVLAELVWSGASAANIKQPDGAVGHITLEAILAHGRRGA
jgi:osmoprotectant transport system ATP-binding protein